MADWISRASGLQDLDAPAKKQLAQLNMMSVAAGKVLFRPGDEVSGFLLMLEGRVDVYMTGPTGRELLLYSVTPGETCVQTVLGLLGEEDYSAEAVAETAIDIVMIPKSMFLDLIASSASFRKLVFQAFANRLQSIMHVLEQVAFIKVESRLAAALLERSNDAGLVHNTHQELATAIGSAREVISRRLELFAKKGLVTLERGTIQITNKTGLMALMS